MADTATTVPAVHPAAKPGYQTTEFWLTLLTMLLGTLLASDALADHNTALEIVGGAMTLLAKFGYVYSRTALKASLPSVAAPSLENAAPAPEQAAA
jgi:hypothetical protein